MKNLFLIHYSINIRDKTEIEEKNALLNFQLMNSNNTINILSFHRFFVSPKLNTIFVLGFLSLWKIAKLYRWQYFIGFLGLILPQEIQLIYIEFSGGFKQNNKIDKRYKIRSKTIISIHDWSDEIEGKLTQFLIEFSDIDLNNKPQYIISKDQYHLPIK
jgi:hypothetical protein